MNKLNQEIYNELMEIAPTLAGISRDNPYKVPEDYFENLEILINPALENNNYIPKDYFLDLPDRVLDSVKDNAIKINSKTNVVSLTKSSTSPSTTVKLWNNYAVRIAASVCLLVMSIVYINNQAKHIDNDNLLSSVDISNSELVDYLELNETDFEKEIYQLSIVDIENTPEILEEITDDELNQYMEDISEYELEELLN